MEVEFDLSVLFEDNYIVRLDQNTLKKLNPRKCWAVKNFIDGIGALSAKVMAIFFFIPKN